MAPHAGHGRLAAEAAAGPSEARALSPRLLLNIFSGLPERAPPSEQGSSLPYLALFASFARTGVSGALADAFEALGRGETAQLGETTVGCCFFPEFGCVLVHLTALGCAAQATSRLHLLGLDGWAFGISGQHFSATAGAPAELFAGAVAASELGGFLECVHTLLSEAEKRKGDERSAAGSRQGHQKTPAFIQALMEQALVDPDYERQPRGGLTDVGLHTGGERRATEWPLAAAVIRCVLEQVDAGLEQTQPSFDAMLPLWELWLAEEAVKAAAGGLPVVDGGAILHMLGCATRRVVALIQDGHVAPDITARVAAVHTAVAELQAAHMRRAAEAYVLPPLLAGGNGIDSQQPRLPVLRIPPAADAQLAATDLAAARARALTNLGWVPLPSLDGGERAAELASWLRAPRIAPADGLPRMAPQLRASAAEHWIYSAAVAMLSQATVKESDSELVGVMQSMEAALDAYRAGIEHALRSDVDGGGRLLVELRSRETLACWAVACLAHRLACKAYPLLKDYRMALAYADLRHLSLSDGLAHEALQAVCAYLRSRTGDGSMRCPVFSLLPTDMTVDFASKMGRNSADITAAWAAEQKHAAGRRNAHWAEVQRKQELARRLRAELVDAKADLHEAEMAVARAPSGSTGRHASAAERAQYYEYQDLLSVVTSCKSAVSSLKTQLKRALEAPEPVVQPLPSDADKALAALFFLYLPPALRTLSRLSFEAQAALLPRPLSKTDSEALRCSALRLEWSAHHAAYQEYVFYKLSPAVRAGAKGAVELGSSVDVPAKKEIGAATVDGMYSASDGVWHPNGLLCLYWQGLDPWRPLPRERMREFYTPSMPPPFAPLQWALPVDDRAHTAPERGNVALAEQEDRPEWLNKPAWLAFAAVRAYPHAQLRKVACALRDRALPLAHAASQLLLRAALYQLGPLRSGDPASRTFLPWKADLTDGPLLDVLHHELTSYADEITDRISEHAALLALLDVLSYVRAWEPSSPRLAALRVRCAGIARRWSAVVEEQVASADDPTAVPALRAKQCMFAMYGIVAHAGSDALNIEEVTSLLRFAVQAHDGYVFQTDAAQPDSPEAFAALRKRCDSVMASRAGALVDAARADDGSLLTAVLREVQPRAPDELSWGEVMAPVSDAATGCFDAPGGDGHLYSINVLTGLVLLDGSPPRSLPADVLAHPLYLRSFGDRDFEVGVTGAGALRTVRPLAGCLYEFFVRPNGQLRVTEMERDAGGNTHALELLDGTAAGVAAWGAQLPVRLRELHSHWLCRADGALYLRDVRVPQRAVSFVGLPDDTDDDADADKGAAAVRCFRVPLHLRCRRAGELAALARSHEQLTDVLQLWPGGPPAPALCKLEAAPLTHWFRHAATGTFSVELPRFRLEFALRAGGVLASKDYSGYELTREQQLRDTLPGFAQYLLLEPGASLFAQPPWGAPVKLLVPSGAVARDGAGAVTVLGDEAPGAARGTWAFDAHDRVGELRAAGVAARLQLAALYAAADTRVPEPRSGTTGAEVALSLVRRCFVNRPASAEEQAACDNVASLSRATPALHVACAHWTACTRQLAFLHPAAKLPRAADDADPHRLADSSMAYLRYAATPEACANPRLLLSRVEELRVLGKRAGAPPAVRSGVAPSAASVVGLAQPPVDAAYVAAAEARLAALVVASAMEKQPFPLGAAAEALSSDTLGAEMLAELRRSWDTKQGLPRHALRSDSAANPPRRTRRGGGGGTAAADKLLALLQAELSAAAQARASAEKFLRAAAAAEPGADATEPLRRATAAARLRRAAGMLPPPTLAELALAALSPEALAALNPLLALSAADAARFLAGALTWMQLGELEDKLSRLSRMAAAAVAAAADADALASLRAEMLKELRTTRTWDVAAHPDWLAFELDGALQIRPAQHALADALLSHAEQGDAGAPGPIVQLNMGEGKTRVIVPMLVLAWARQRRRVRLNLLSQLLPEALLSQLLPEALPRAPHGRPAGHQALPGALPPRRGGDARARGRAAGAGRVGAPRGRRAADDARGARVAAPEAA
jgi:hypothetical protein